MPDVCLCVEDRGSAICQGGVLVESRGCEGSRAVAGWGPVPCCGQ